MPVDHSPLPNALVSASWLARRLLAGDPGLLVVDATVYAVSGGYVTGDEKYLLEGHLPGAVFADLLEEFSDPFGHFPFTRPNAARFAAAAGRLGIGPDTTVVVYDGSIGQWASRFWWLLRSFGHDRAAVLDGGLVAWTATGGALDVGHVEPVPAVFEAHERPELWVDKAEIERILAGGEEATLVCSVPPKEFSGEVSPRPRAGHIPGSVSIPVGRLFDRESNTFLGEETLREVLAPAIGGRVIAYCGGGIAASNLAFNLLRAGWTDLAVYDGSLDEWGRDPALPMETGPG